jgi:hypothetical protein
MRGCARGAFRILQQPLSRAEILFAFALELRMVSFQKIGRLLARTAREALGRAELDTGTPDVSPD